MTRTIRTMAASVAVLVLATGCASASPDASPDASASPAPVASIDPSIPLEDQLFDALRVADLELIELLIDAGVDIDAELGDGSTAVHIAVIRDDAELLELLLSADPDLTLTNGSGDGVVTV